MVVLASTCRRPGYGDLASREIVDVVGAGFCLVGLVDDVVAEVVGSWCVVVLSGYVLVTSRLSAS